MLGQVQKSFLKRFNSINEQNEIRKTNQTISNNMINFGTSQQTKKKIQRLEKQAKQHQDKRQQVETRFQNFKQRFVNRQRQFYRILERFNTPRILDAKDDHYVTEIYQKILCTFDAFNQKARQLLDDRYSELYRLMQRRIDILMQKMDKQLSKYRKIAESERKQIQDAIKEIGIIAAQTEKQNTTFRKKNQNLQLRLQMINDEKRLLLEEITGLKIFVLKNKKKSKPIDKSQQFQSKLNVKMDFWNNTESIQVEHLSISKNKIPSANRQNRYSSQQSEAKNKGTTISMQKTIDFSITERKKPANQDNTIFHLTQCLTREKNKNLQLIKYSLELQAKQQKIKQLIFEQINKNATRGSQRSLIQSDNELNELDLLLESEDIIHNNKQCSINVEMVNSKGQIEVLPQRFNQKLQQQRQLSKLINEINKILHLPQTDKNDYKSQMKQNNESSVIIQKEHHNPHKDHKMFMEFKEQNFIKINNVQSSRRKLSAQKQPQPVSALGNRSLRYGHNQNKQKGYLFVNYSPLDLVDIAKSIQIK